MMTKTITTLYLLLGLLHVRASTTYFDVPSYWLFAVKEDQSVRVRIHFMCEGLSLPFNLKSCFLVCTDCLSSFVAQYWVWRSRSSVPCFEVIQTVIQ